MSHRNHKLLLLLLLLLLTSMSLVSVNWGTLILQADIGWMICVRSWGYTIFPDLTTQAWLCRLHYSSTACLKGSRHARPCPNTGAYRFIRVRNINSVHDLNVPKSDQQIMGKFPNDEVNGPNFSDP